MKWRKESNQKKYLGDGCYAEWDGSNCWLYTSDGVHITNEICLEPSVLRELLRFLVVVEGTPQI